MVNDLFFSKNWLTEVGVAVPPFTHITADDIRTGKFRFIGEEFVRKEQILEYLLALENIIDDGLLVTEEPIFITGNISMAFGDYRFQMASIPINALGDSPYVLVTIWYRNVVAVTDLMLKAFDTHSQVTDKEDTESENIETIDALAHFMDAESAWEFIKWFEIWYAQIPALTNMVTKRHAGIPIDAADK